MDTVLLWEYRSTILLIHECVFCRDITPSTALVAAGWRRKKEKPLQRNAS